MHKYIAKIVVMLMVAMGCLGCASDTGSSKQADIAKPVETAANIGVTVGNIVPGVMLAGLDGTQKSFGEAGKITVINFWATWCPPCKEEMPELDKFSSQYRDTVAFYAVNIQEPGDTVSSFLRQHKYTMPVYLDSDGTVAKLFRVRAIPTTIVADKTGLIKFRTAGAITAAELEGIIKGL